MASAKINTDTIEYNYQIAFMREDGGWDIMSTFTAENDADAQNWAEELYPGQEEWYVLYQGRNINA